MEFPIGTANLSESDCVTRCGRANLKLVVKLVEWTRYEHKQMSQKLASTACKLRQAGGSIDEGSAR